MALHYTDQEKVIKEILSLFAIHYFIYKYFVNLQFFEI